MTLRNRVTPLGEVIADPARGLVYGNRGCMHDAHGRIRRAYGVRRWIACRLAFRGWQRGAFLQPGRFTELFFLDEATAFAAGHRPCAMCRHDDYRAFVAAWAQRHPLERSAAAIDRHLHAERFDETAKVQRRHGGPIARLPDGAFVLRDGEPWLVLDRDLRRWTPAGYTDREPRPSRGLATVITPPSVVAVLSGGWHPDVPFLHPSAR
jgi:hypothetical protein